MKVYVVKAVRYGDFEKHSYNVGVFSDLETAKMEANEEYWFRGGKYNCYVYEFEVNCVIGAEPEKEYVFFVGDYR